MVDGTKRSDTYGDRVLRHSEMGIARRRCRRLTPQDCRIPRRRNGIMFLTKGKIELSSGLILQVIGHSDQEPIVSFKNNSTFVGLEGWTRNIVLLVESRVQVPHT